MCLRLWVQKTLSSGVHRAPSFDAFGSHCDSPASAPAPQSPHLPSSPSAPASAPCSGSGVRDSRLSFPVERELPAAGHDGPHGDRVPPEEVCAALCLPSVLVLLSHPVTVTQVTDGPGELEVAQGHPRPLKGTHSTAAPPGTLGSSQDGKTTPFPEATDFVRMFHSSQQLSRTQTDFTKLVFVALVTP